LRGEYRNIQSKAANGKLRDDIVKKVPDSFLYRWRRQRYENRFYFLSLITLEDALLNNFQEICIAICRSQALLVGRARLPELPRHQYSGVNRKFSQMAVRRLSDTP